MQKWTDGRQGLARQTGGRQVGRRSGRLPLGLREQQADMEPRAHQGLRRAPPVGPSEAAAADIAARSVCRVRRKGRKRRMW